jgi:phthalate 4,5-dioxygenase oxygenase subunit
MLRAEDNRFLTESGPGTGMGELPRRLYQDRYAVRSGACVTSKAKDLTAVMTERFGDAAGYVGRPGQNAATE